MITINPPAATITTTEAPASPLDLAIVNAVNLAVQHGVSATRTHNGKDYLLSGVTGRGKRRCFTWTVV